MSSKNKKPLHRLWSAVQQAIRKAQTHPETASDAPEVAKENGVKIMSVAERKAKQAHKREQAERRALEWAREQQAARQLADEKPIDAIAPKNESTLDE